MQIGHESEHRVGKRLSCGEFHLYNSCELRNSKHFKHGKIGHIRSVCKINVYFVSDNSKLCHSDPIYPYVSNGNILSLFTTFNNSLHFQKRLCLSSGSFHDFIVNTDKSIISLGKLKSLNSVAIILPTNVPISNGTGHKLSINKSYSLLNRDDKSSVINRELIITDCGQSMQGLENLRMLQGQLSQLTTENGSSEMLDNVRNMEWKCGNLRTTPKSPHSHVLARNFKDLRPNVDSTTATKFKNLSLRAESLDRTQKKQ